MMDTLLAPFAFPFMVNALLLGAIIAIPTGLLSCFLVLKGWALMGDAVSHAVLPGIILAAVFGLPVLLGAFAAGMFTAVASGFLVRRSRVKEDTVMGVVFSGMFALGLVLLTVVESGVDIHHVLFGNILGVGRADLIQTGVIAGVVGFGLLVFWRDLMVLAFDETHARAIGLPVGRLHYALLAALSLIIVATLSATGLILAIGLIIAPGAIAFLLVRTFGAMLAVASAVCLVSVLTGVYASFFIDSAPAPTVILVLTALFVMALTWKLGLRAQLGASPARRRDVNHRS